MYQLDPFLRQNKAVMSFPWHGFRLLKLKNAQVLPKLSQLHPIRLDWHHSCFVRLALKMWDLAAWENWSKMVVREFLTSLLTRKQERGMATAHRYLGHHLQLSNYLLRFEFCFQIVWLIIGSVGSNLFNPTFVEVNFWMAKSSESQPPRCVGSRPPRVRWFGAPRHCPVEATRISSRGLLDPCGLQAPMALLEIDDNTMISAVRRRKISRWYHQIMIYHDIMEALNSMIRNSCINYALQNGRDFLSGFFHNLWQVGRGCQASSFFNDTFRLRRAGDLKDATCALTNCCPIIFVDFFQDLSINEDSIASPYDVQRTKIASKYRIFSCKWCYLFLYGLMWCDFPFSETFRFWRMKNPLGYPNIEKVDHISARWTQWTTGDGPAELEETSYKTWGLALHAVSGGMGVFWHRTRR